jgi:hypothetical protein
MDSKAVVAAPAADACTELDAVSSPESPEPPVPTGAWTRDVEALCRALDAQQRAHLARAEAKDK